MEGLVQGLTGVFQALEQLWSIVPLPTLYLAAMAGVILWGGSLRGRIFQLGAREAMGWGIWVWLAWLAIRLLRLTLVTGWDTLHRLLWYGFYPCMGLLIFLVVWISFASNRRPEDGMLPRWLQGLLILDLLLAGLVLTNDWHQQVFRIFPSPGHHRDVYTYGSGYFLILGSYLVQLLLANGWLAWRAWKEKFSLLNLWAPLTILLLYGGYIAGYILRVPCCFRTEFVLRTAVFGFLWMESLLRCRLLPGNS